VGIARAITKAMIERMIPDRIFVMTTSSQQPCGSYLLTKDRY
jgi:hypothetical protein